MKKGFNNNLKYDSKINLQSNDNDIIIKTETNPEGTFYWYKNNYYSYGVQRLKKNKELKTKGRTKKQYQKWLKKQGDKNVTTQRFR